MCLDGGCYLDRLSAPIPARKVPLVASHSHFSRIHSILRRAKTHAPRSGLAARISTSARPGPSDAGCRDSDPQCPFDDFLDVHLVDVHSFAQFLAPWADALCPLAPVVSEHDNSARFLFAIGVPEAAGTTIQRAGGVSSPSRGASTARLGGCGTEAVAEADPRGVEWFRPPETRNSGLAAVPNLPCPSFDAA